MLHSNQIINEWNGIESMRCIYNRKVICIKHHYRETKRNFLAAANESDHKMSKHKKRGSTKWNELVTDAPLKFDAETRFLAQ